MSKKQILILSCSTGGGHNAAAFALKEEIEHQGHQAVIIDYLSFANKKFETAACNFYANTVSYTPHIFGAGYRTNLMMSKAHLPSPTYYWGIPLAKKLKDYLSEQSFDGIIMTHLYAAEGLTYLKRNGVAIPKSIAISTDYICHPYWEYLDCDYHILPHEDLIDSFIARGIPQPRLRAFGIPVRTQFRKKKSKLEARTEMHLSSVEPIYLVMAGSLGTGNVQALVKGLITDVGKGIVAVLCGSNRKLYNKLNEKFKHNPRILPVGPVNNVADWMSACDVLFSKPGGLTSTEALVHNTPLVHTAPIPGCENANMDFFVKHGLSLSARTIKHQILCGRDLVNNPVIRNTLLQRQSENAHPDACERIISLITK